MVVVLVLSEIPGSVGEVMSENHQRQRTQQHAIDTSHAIRQRRSVRRKVNARLTPAALSEKS